MKEFAGKTVFITGGASGIGFGLAQAFAEVGMKVALGDIEPGPLEEAAGAIKAMGAEAIAVPLDVTDRAAMFAAADTAEAALGKIHMVCANAGVGGEMLPLDEETGKDWDWVIGVNLMGVINATLAFLPKIKKHGEGGHFCMTSSMSGLRVFNPTRHQGIYNTTKFALMGLGEALWLDMKPHNIGVSILCPGFVRSRLGESGRNRPDALGGVFKRDRPMQPAETRTHDSMDALEYARWVRKAVGRDQLFVVTHPFEREMVEERHRRLMEAFDAIPELQKG